MWIFSAMNLPLIAVDPRTQEGEVPAGHPFCAVVIDDTSFEVFRNSAKRPVEEPHACPLREKVALVRFDMKTYTAAAAPFPPS